VRARWITDWTPSRRWPHYTRATAADVLPAPVTPLATQLCWERGLIPGWRDAYVESGAYCAEEFDQDLPEVVGFFGGYFYLNLSNVRMQGVRSPALSVEQLDAAIFGARDDVPPYVPHADDDRPDLRDAVIAHLAWILNTQEYPEADEFADQARLARAERPDPEVTSNADLLARLRRLQAMLRTGFRLHRVATSASGVAPGLLHAIGAAIGDPELAMMLCTGIGDVESAEPAFRLWELSRLVRNNEALSRAFDAGIDGVIDRIDRLDVGPTDDHVHVEVVEFLGEWHRFVEDFGSFALNDWELHSRTWETDPSLLLGALERMRHQNETEAPLIRARQRSTERATKLAEIRTAIADLHNDELAAQLEGAVNAINQLVFRARTKTALARVIHECRMIVLELGRRAVAAGALDELDHVFMLQDHELDRFARGDSGSAARHEGPANDELAERYRRWRELHELEPPFFVVDGRVPPLDEWARTEPETVAAPCVAGDEVQGVPGCSGIVRGRACVVDEPARVHDLSSEDVLVLPDADTAWSALFGNAAGLVLADGGQISHSVIVARELGVPCVASVADACERIPHGATIEIDGTAGTVTVVEVP